MRSRGQEDKAITLCLNCCAYGLFLDSRSFMQQAAYLTGEGHFIDIIDEIFSSGTVDKRMIMEWLSEVARDLDELHRLSEPDFDKTVNRSMMRLSQGHL